MKIDLFHTEVRLKSLYYSSIGKSDQFTKEEVNAELEKYSCYTGKNVVTSMNERAVIVSVVLHPSSQIAFLVRLESAEEKTYMSQALRLGDSWA